ncbi:MAG: NADH-quinone oxidoreductase subunit J [bacterium]
MQPAGVAAPANMSSAQVLGISLLRVYALPFEIASVLLLVAMIGAIIIARKE